MALFRSAMAQGHAEAMCFVASLYMEGTGGLEKDLDQVRLTSSSL